MANLRKSEEHKREVAAAAAPAAPRRRDMWMRTEILLLVIGLALLAVYAAARFESLLSSRAALRMFTAAAPTAAKANPQGRENSRPARSRDVVNELVSVDFSLWDQGRIQEYTESFFEKSSAPMGVLRIAKIHLEVPLLDGTDDLTLNHAVGRIAGTARPGEAGNMGIAGHRDGFFRGLKDVRVGDAVELSALQGTDTYKVDDIRIVSPNDVSVLLPRAVPSVTLVTCYPFYFIGSAPKRYIVTASLSREIQNGPENLNAGPLSQTSSPKRRNNEQLQ